MNTRLGISRVDRPSSPDPDISGCPQRRPYSPIRTRRMGSCGDARSLDLATDLLHHGHKVRGVAGVPKCWAGLYGDTPRRVIGVRDRSPGTHTPNTVSIPRVEGLWTCPLRRPPLRRPNGPSFGPKGQSFSQPGSKALVTATSTPFGPTGQPFPEPRGHQEEWLARWAGTCRGRSFPARWAGLGERLAPWAARRLLPPPPRAMTDPSGVTEGSRGSSGATTPGPRPPKTPAPRSGCQKSWVNPTNVDAPHRPARRPSCASVSVRYSNNPRSGRWLRVAPGDFSGRRFARHT